MTRRALVGLAALLCLGALAPSPAHAYVLPADFLCRLLADSRRQSLRDVTLVLRAELADHDGPVDERLYLKRPERLRLVQGNEATGKKARIAVISEGLAASGDEGVLHDDGTSPNPWPALLFPKGADLDETSARMLEAIEAVGIDVAQVSLGRYAGGFAYVIGAKPWENGRPQLWLDKTTYQPVRLLWPAGASPSKAKPAAASAAPDPNAPTSPAMAPGAGMHELRLLGYVGGLPRRIEEWEDGRLLRRSEVVQVRTNQGLPESLFALPQSGQAP